MDNASPVIVNWINGMIGFAKGKFLSLMMAFVWMFKLAEKIPENLNPSSGMYSLLKTVGTLLVGSPSNLQAGS